MCRPVSGRLPAIFWAVQIVYQYLKSEHNQVSHYARNIKLLSVTECSIKICLKTLCRQAQGTQKHICDLCGSRSRSELYTKSWKEGIEAWFHVVWLKLSDIYCKFYSIKTAQNVHINLRSLGRWRHLFAAELITTEQIIARWLVITN